MLDLRHIDSHKLQFHPRRVAQWKESEDDWEKAKTVYPLYVEISPMGACNHRCTFCAVDYIGYKPENKLDSETMCLRLAEMGGLGVKSVMFAGEGEPLLHKRIDDFVLWSKNGGMDVAFTTNGVLLDRLDRLSSCSWVKVSLNAGSRDTYAKVHRTKPEDWDRVWQNLREARARKGGCDIGVQMVVLPENKNEIEELAGLCADAGVDYLVIKPYSQHKMSITKQYDGFKMALPEDYTIGSTRVVFRSEAMKTQGHQYDKCNATPFFWAYLMASGDIYSCSAYLLDDRFKLGNVQYETFQQIWEGERRRANWELVTKHLDIHECRVNCRMDKANRYLAEFDTVRNVNFV